MSNREIVKTEDIDRFLRLDFIKEAELQEITRLAAQICQVPISIINLQGEDHMLYIKYKFGEASVESKTVRYPFCDQIENQHEPLIVHDASQDGRFANDPLVTGSPYIRFYAVYPLIGLKGEVLGSLAVIGNTAGELSEQQQQMLKTLSRQALNLIDFDASLEALKKQFITAKNSEIKLRSFFESSSSCHLLIDRNLKVMAFNSILDSFTARVFGIRIAEGMSALDFTHPSYLADFKSHCNAALTGQHIQIEQLIRYETESIWWYITYNPARDPEGNIIGISYNATDITKLISQEQKVQAQNESLRKIAFIQSHELRRPVASILGLMDIIETEGFNPTREELLMLKKSAEELDQKIRLVVNYTHE